MQQSHCRMFARLEVGGGSTVVTVAMEWGRRSWLTWLLSTSTWYGCVLCFVLALAQFLGGGGFF